MKSNPKCQAKNPATCVDPNCPERRGHVAALNAAIKNGDINAFFAAKDKQLSNFTPYKSASGLLEVSLFGLSIL